MKGMWIGIVLVLGVRLLQGQLYDPSKYSLGNNLVQNFNFKLPAVSRLEIYNGGIPSWTCSPNCEVQNSTDYCLTNSRLCPPSWQQNIDLNSHITFFTISQVIEISVAGKYLVYFEWLRPTVSSLDQQAEVRINGTVIRTVTVNSSSDILYIQEVLVELPAGNLTLSFQQIGTPSSYYGILVSNVKMQELLPIPDEEKDFYLELELSEVQNQTVGMINSGLETANAVVENSFALIFSSPLAAFFISLLNYFTLSSLYVLLNIRLPKVVFESLKLMYSSCSTDMLSHFGFDWRMEKWSEERVADPRPRYFKVTTDFVSENLNETCIILANVLLVELFIFGSSFFPRLSRFGRGMASSRGQIYVGLVLSNAVELLLPWKYSFFGSYRTPQTKVVIGAQYILLYLLPFLGIATFLGQLETNQKEHKRYVLVSLRNCWPIYELLVVSIMVLIRDPIYFMVVVGIGNLFSLYLALHTTSWRASWVLKAIYPLILHACFFVFMFASDPRLLAYTGIIYLATLLLGAVHHFLETLTVLAKQIYSGLRKLCRSNAVEPQEEGRAKGKGRGRGEVEGEGKAKAKGEAEAKAEGKKKGKGKVKACEGQRKGNLKKRPKEKEKEEKKEKAAEVVKTGKLNKNVDFVLRQNQNDWRIELIMNNKNKTQPPEPTKKEGKSKKAKRTKKQKQVRDSDLQIVENLGTVKPKPGEHKSDQKGKKK